MMLVSSVHKSWSAMKKNIDPFLNSIFAVLSVTFLVGVALSSSVMAQEKRTTPAAQASEDDATPGKAPTPVELNADNMEYKSAEGVFVATGHVVLKKEDSVLTCTSLEFSREKGEAHADGDVVLKTPKGTIWADKGFYNFNSKQGEFTDARIMAYPMFGEARKIARVSENHYVMTEGYLTTSDYDNPEWRIRSRSIDLFPGDKAVARDTTMFVGGTPVMFWPKYTQDLTGKRAHISVTPGYKKSFGAYVLTSYRMGLTPHIEPTIHLDYREKRGLAGGVDVKYEPPQMGQGLIRTYYMNDRNPELSGDLTTLEHLRYRYEWRHKWDIDPATTAIVQYYKLSDADFLKTYFNKEYRNDQNPATYFQLTRTMANSSLTLRADVRANHFDSIVERLPEVNYTLNSQQLGDTGLYVKSSNTASSLVKKDAAPSEVRNSTVRLDTDNEISRPVKLAFLELRPYVGTEQTYYSRTLDTQDSDIVRGMLKTGMDVSTKFYQVYDVNFKKYGIEVNQLRHVITPTVSYQYQSEPTRDPAELFPFDDIDTRDRINKFALGFENKLQTKREGQSVDLLRSLLTTDYRMEGNSSRGSFGDVTWENDLYPNKYVTFRSDATYDNDGDHLRTANFDVYLKDLKKWELDFSRRWTYHDDDILTTQLTYKFNPKWRTAVYNRFNADNGQNQEQQYSFIRDLHTWEMEFAYNVKHDGENSGNEVWMIFRLKAFPSVSASGGASFSQARPGAPSAI
jgi:LPS-assembly protein